MLRNCEDEKNQIKDNTKGLSVVKYLERNRIFR